MDIKIRNVPTQVANEIDKIAKDEGISQNTLYNKIISDYVKSRDDFVVNILPPIVRALVNLVLSISLDTFYSNKNYAARKI